MVQPDNIIYIHRQNFHHFQPPQNNESMAMSWKETNIMKQRIRFIQAGLRRYTKVKLC